VRPRAGRQTILGLRHFIADGIPSLDCAELEFVTTCHAPSTGRCWDATISGKQGWPVAFWKHHPVADQSADTLAEATLAFQQEFNFDIVKVTPEGTYQAAGYGLVDQWAGDPLGRREVVDRPVKQPADWDAILRSTCPGTRANAVLEAARLIARTINAQAVVLQTVFNPLTQLVQLCGLPLLQEQISSNRRTVELALARVTGDTCRLIQKVAASGLDGIYLATQAMNHSMFTPSQYARWGTPFDRECMRAAGTMSTNVLHVHGEHIYFALDGWDQQWALHYELTPMNPQPCAAPDGALLTGIPAAQLLQCDTTGERCELLRSLSRDVRGRPCVLSSGCTLPLDFPQRTIHGWIGAARGTG